MTWYKWLNPIASPPPPHHQPSLLFCIVILFWIASIVLWVSFLFVICAQEFEMDDGWSDHVNFVNVHLFPASLGPRSLKTFWSLVILILNYLNFGFEMKFTWNYKWSVVLHSNVTELKCAYIISDSRPQAFLKVRGESDSPYPSLSLHAGPPCNS